MSFLNKEQSIVIVGAGIFGLSTALHLAQDGFSNVTVFDGKPYGQSLYDQTQGCDAASADVNKILRASCAFRRSAKTENKQNISVLPTALERLGSVGTLLAATPANQRPPGLESTSDLYVECGFLRIPRSPMDPLPKEELAGLANLEKQFPEYRLKNYIVDDPVERKRAEADGWEETLRAVKWNGTGVLDTTAGLVRADKACIWLAHLAQKAGVQLVEGEKIGKVVGLVEVEKTGEKHVKGVKTADGKMHSAALVIVAGGGWTPVLLPATRKLLETTAGSVVSLTLPPSTERPDLWQRFSEKRWPVIARNMDPDKSASCVIYSFPHLEGTIKVGYRVTKFTNYADLPDGDRISVPITAYTTPSQTDVPIVSLEAVKDYIRDHFPELVSLGISYTRLCWYTDSIDNNFLIDYVPGYGKSLFVASGGSGHGFKFAPVLGAHVLDALCGRETDLTLLWRWRPVPEGKRNGLEEGEAGPRVLSKQKMATKDDWKIEPSTAT